MNKKQLIVAWVVIATAWLISCFIFYTINIGFTIFLLFMIGLGVYKMGEDAGKRKMEDFKIRVEIDLDEKRERLLETENKLYDMEDEDYELSKDSDMSHSKEALIDKLNKEKDFLEDKINKIEQEFLEIGEEIPD